MKKIGCQRIRGQHILNKYIIIIVIATLFSIGFKSCCTDRGCAGVAEIDDVLLLNFASTDVDSIFVVSYSGGSGFRTVADSFRVERCDSLGNGKYYMFLNGKRININYDYQIYFTKIYKAYKIRGFETSKAECNDCSPGIIKDYFIQLDGYEINGKFKYLGNIQIDKNVD